MTDSATLPRAVIDDEPTLAVAERESIEARQRLTHTLVEIQRRLNPKALARDAVQEIRQASEGLAREGMDAARRHPATIGGIILALIVFVARGPLIDLFKRRDDATDAKAPRLPSKTRSRGK